MNYELTLQISEDSLAGRNIEAMAQTAHLSREEAALKLLESQAPISQSSTPHESRRAAVEAVSGMLSDNAWILDDFNAEKQAAIDREDERDLI